MDIDDIRTQLQETLRSVAPEADLPQLRPDQPLRQQIELDSLDWLNVIAGLHERLRIDIPPADHGRLTTLDETVAYLAARLGDAAAAAPRADAGAPAAPSRSEHRIRGVEVTVRPIRAEDAPAEAEFVRRLSATTRYKRFMVTLHELPAAKLKYFTEVDQAQHVAMVATVARDGAPAIVAVARYVVEPAGDACEFAIAVDDAWQGSGLAGILMQALIDHARARGLARMEGIVLADNRPMLRFVRQLGFAVQPDPDDRHTVRVVRAL